MSDLDASQIRNRLRALIEMRGNREAAAEELIESLASSPEECADALRVLGPTALRELERRTLRSFLALGSGSNDHRAYDAHGLTVVGSDPPVPVDNSGDRKPLLLWTLQDVEAHLRFTKKMQGAIATRVRDMTTIRERLREGQTIGDVWHSLTPDSRKRLAAFGGVKRLAA